MADQDFITRRRMTEDKKEGGARWEMQEAWRRAVEARRAGDAEAEALAMRRYADGLVNASYSGIEKLVSPLVELQREQAKDLDKIADVVQYVATTLGRIDAATAEIAALREAQQATHATMLEAVDRLGGLESRVERVEVGLARVEIRVEAVESHGAPADAVMELQTVNRRLNRLELWVVLLTVAITANALIYFLVISTGGGR